MQSKNGKLVKLTKPVTPEKPELSDPPDPGEVAKTKAAQAKSGKGKYGSQTVKPMSSTDSSATSPAGGDKSDSDKTSFFAARVVDADGQPVSGEVVDITLPDGTTTSATTDADGNIRIDNIPAGDAQPQFSRLDKTVLSE